MRKIKISRETDVLTRAGLITEQSIAEAFRSARAGDRDKDIAGGTCSNAIRLGADSIRFRILGSGPNSLLAHYIPGEKRLLEGELVRVDIGACFGAFASDVARMAVVNEANSTVTNTYRAYRDIQRATIAQMGVGVRAADIYDYCQRAYERAGFVPRSPHIGHWTGVDGGHEEPLLHPGNQQRLEPNTMFYVEPILMDPQIGTYHVENLVRITEGDPELLTAYSSTEKICVIG